MENYTYHFELAETKNDSSTESYFSSKNLSECLIILKAKLKPKSFVDLWVDNTPIYELTLNGKLKDNLCDNTKGSLDDCLLNHPKITQEQREDIMDQIYNAYTINPAA